jgi:predicted nucleotide-binding protein (sugar kinase/HSP70/actin superfamily)
MEADTTFQSLSRNVGTFDVREKTFLLPEMSRIGSHLMCGAFRSFGIRARVMDTYRGLELGREFTSGKECYPCQVTTGDILHFIREEQIRLGDRFDPEDYIYFMPEAGGPCRFGMYNKFQRIILDSFPDLRTLKIGSLTSDNAYSPAGMLEAERTTDFRKAAYFAVVVGDILDRLLWRVRPYERDPGTANEFIERAMDFMSDIFYRHAGNKEFDIILDALEELVVEGKELTDPSIPRKPLIGIVGEIYLRTHNKSNQDLIVMLERYGGEVVNASLAEWINYTAYDGLRQAKLDLINNLRLFRFGKIKEIVTNILSYGGDLLYQNVRQNQAYKRIMPLLDIPADHSVSDLEDALKKDDLFTFDIGTEACLSIAGIMEYIHDGYDGVVNVYPFTCMPSTITSAVIKPLVSEKRLPYLDTPCDGTYQPGREAAIRTFIYQAQQHQRRRSGRQGPH